MQQISSSAPAFVPPPPPGGTPDQRRRRQYALGQFCAVAEPLAERHNMGRHLEKTIRLLARDPEKLLGFVFKLSHPLLLREAGSVREAHHRLVDGIMAEIVLADGETRIFPERSSDDERNLFHMGYWHAKADLAAGKPMRRLDA